MRVTESLVAAAFAGLGLRSILYWVRRPFETADLRDHLLFAAYLTGRIGLWFSLCGLFLLLSFDTDARPGEGSSSAFVDFALRYKWYTMVFAVLAALQLVAGFFLGNRSTDASGPEGRRPEA